MDTLGSVLRQRDPDIRVIVVANEDPAADLPDDPRLEVVRVPYPPSASTPGKPSLVGIEIDKGAKLGIGTSRATALGADHVMWVDSDDFVHRDIAGTVAASPEVPGWYFDSGYFHIRGERKVTLGAPRVPPAQRLEPRAADRRHRRAAPTSTRRSRATRCSTRSAVRRRPTRWAATGPSSSSSPPAARSLAPFPYPAAIWEIGTGENCTGVFAAAGPKVPIAGRIAEDFGLAVPDRTTAARAKVAVYSARVSRRIAHGS